MSLYYDYQIKIILVGDSGCGKSSLCQQISTHTFNDNCQSTVGVDFITKVFEINEKKKLVHYKAHIWDTAGQEMYKSLITSYYKRASGIILVFDLNDERGFRNIRNWYEEVKLYSPPESPIILLGNKCDLIQKIDIKEIQDFTENNNIPYIITSAKDYKNTYNAFIYLINKINDQFENELNVHVIKKNNVFYIDSDKYSNNSCCY